MEYNRVSERMNLLFYRGFDKTEILKFEDKLRKIMNNLEEN